MDFSTATWSVTRPRKSSTRAYSLLEVMIAASVVILTLTSSLAIVGRGFLAIDRARYETLAGEILQSQMNRLLLLNWSQLTGLVATESFTPNPGSASGQSNLPKNFSSFQQSITYDSSPTFNNTVLNIVLTTNWTGADGHPHSLSYIARYGQYGLYDFLSSQ